jgi:Rrf2 family protein
MAANTQLSVATHILIVLARAPEAHEPKEGLVCSEVIAHSIDTNPVVVRRIVADLARAGLVVSYPGKGGGLALGRSPEAITLLQVHEAVCDGSVVGFKAHPPNAACPLGASMADAIASVFGEVERSIRAQLAATTLAALVRQVAEANDHLSIPFIETTIAGA